MSRSVKLFAILLGALALAACGDDKKDQDSQSSSSPCDNQTCSGHGTCSVNGGSAACTCDRGYTAQGLTCVASNLEIKGSCDVQGQADAGVGTGHLCMQYPASLPWDPANTCTGLQGTYSTNPCPTTESIGYCTYLGYQTYFYSDASGVNAQTYCSLLSGSTWTALP